jgi:hypothetical protein
MAELIEYPSSVTMKAWLTGHQFDLQDLADLLGSGSDVRVIRAADRFFLSAAELDNPPIGVAFHDVAQKLVIRINGLARVQKPGFSPVDLAGHYDEDGNVYVAGVTARVEVRAHVSATAVVTGPSGTPVQQAPPASSRYLALAARSTDVAEALEIMGRPESLNFAELYKVYEIIEHAGALKAAMKSAGVPETSRALFSRTANHPDASGADARHARSRQAPPKNPMTIEEALTLIRRLLVAWMDSLSPVPA